MEDITNADYTHAKRVCKEFEIKNLRKYHDLYVITSITFEICILKYMTLIPLVFLLHQVYHGKQL